MTDKNSFKFTKREICAIAAIAGTVGALSVIGDTGPDGVPDYQETIIEPAHQAEVRDIGRTTLQNQHVGIIDPAQLQKFATPTPAER